MCPFVAKELFKMVLGWTKNRLITFEIKAQWDPMSFTNFSYDTLK